MGSTISDAILDLVVLGASSGFNVFLGDGSNGQGDGDCTLQTPIAGYGPIIGDRRMHIYTGGGIDGIADATFTDIFEVENVNNTHELIVHDIDSDGIADILIRWDSKPDLRLFYGLGSLVVSP